MILLAEILAVCCIVYYVVIAVYSGSALSFMVFWLGLAAVLGGIATWLHYVKVHGNPLPVWANVGLKTVLFTLICVFAITEVIIFSNSIHFSDAEADYCIVLGARVRGDEVSASLKRRVDKAFEYAEEYPDCILVLSGGKGNGENISEARAMADYLAKRGVSEDRMLIEDQSTSTEENIRFSKAVIENREFYESRKTDLPMREVRVAVLSSNYHLFRAREIASGQDLKGVIGIAASTDPILMVHQWVREGFAVLKDKFMGRF